MGRLSAAATTTPPPPPQPPNLTSPGRAASRRATAERKLARTTNGAMDDLLSAVLADARGALKAPVLLADGAAVQATYQPFTLGTVLYRWGQVVSSIVGSLTNLLGPVHQAGDPYIAGANLRLLASQLPSDVYDSVRAVLRTSQSQGWDAETTQAALINALSLDTPTTTETSGALPGTDTAGPSWRAQAERIARTEATGAVGHRTVVELAQGGHARKRWVAHHDNLTRPAHLAADGQTVPTTASFLVDGYAMQFPGDPSAPTYLTANCRCVVVGVE